MLVSRLKLNVGNLNFGHMTSHLEEEEWDAMSRGAMRIVALFAINPLTLTPAFLRSLPLPLIYKICANKNYTIRQTEKIIIKRDFLFLFFLFLFLPLSRSSKKHNSTNTFLPTDNKQHLINALSVIYRFSSKKENFLLKQLINLCERKLN